MYRSYGKEFFEMVSYKQKKELVIDLKAIYKSPSAEDPQVKPLVDAK